MSLGAETDLVGNPVAAPSDWLSLASDPTEAAAASYRIGMAATHWVGVHMLGLGQTIHVDSLPAGDKRRTATRPDLVGTHPANAPHDWLLEAKGGIRVTSRARLDGSYQLHSPASAGWTQPHVQALVAASLDPFLHLAVDIGLPISVSATSGTTDPAAWPLAGARSRSAEELFWARATIAAALIDTDADRVALPNLGNVWLVRVPGADVSVGLTDGAYNVARLQVLAVRDSGVAAEGQAVADVVRVTDLGGWEVLEALDAPSRGGVRLLPPADAPGVGAAADVAGRVIVAGSSWRSPPADTD